MKKTSLFLAFIALALVMSFSACNSNSKPAESTENTETAPKEASVSISPENIEALVDADWDSIPQQLLDTMGIKALQSFKQEAKEAQVDNLQYYYGTGATVELDKEGQPVKITADNDNAVVIYLTAESVAYGTIAFSNEADYNDFMKKVEAKGKAQEEEGFEYEGKGKNTKGEEAGYEKDKWFFVSFTADK